MSRSRKKTPICGITTAESEKEDKRYCNRKMRRKSKSILKYTQDQDKLPIDKNEIMNVWDMAKDGRQEFDPEEHPEIMRK